MPVAALELNDQSLLIQADDGTLHAEPGFARVTPAGIVTGDDARAAAWHEPQNVYNQYWCLLNQTPLAARHKWARHHADIAFVQLGNLWREAGSPGSLQILSPGSFSDAQLSLLIGMLKALPATPVAVIDSALAACLEARQDTLFVDLQLHQSVLTVCRARSGSISVAEQEVLPDLGLLHVHNIVARAVSNLLIDSYRYDPLHAPGTEQAVYDRIPSWLLRLRFEDEISDALPSDKGALHFILRRDAIRARIESRFVNLHAFLDRHAGMRVVLAHGSGLLGGLSARLADTEVAAQTAATELCLGHYAQIAGQLDGLVRVRELQRELPPHATPGPEQPLATHVLLNDRALPLSRPVSVCFANGQVELLDRVDDDAVLTIVLHNGALETLHTAADLDAEVPKTGRAGEVLRVAGHELRLIEVR